MNEAQAAQVIQRRWKKKKSELDLFVVVNKHVDNIETIWDEVDKLDENDIENFMHGVNGKKLIKRDRTIIKIRKKRVPLMDWMQKKCSRLSEYSMFATEKKIYIAARRQNCGRHNIHRIRRVWRCFGASDVCERLV